MAKRYALVEGGLVAQVDSDLWLLSQQPEFQRVMGHWKSMTTDAVPKVKDLNGAIDVNSIVAHQTLCSFVNMISEGIERGRKQRT